jgi:RNA polymerase sigma factor (sigma-70 family)
MVDDRLVDERAEQRSASGRAQARLFDEQRTGLTRLALLLTGSRPVAEELVQDAFEQVVRRWDVIHTPAGYVRSAVISGARSWGRRRTPPPLDRRDVVRLDEEAVAVRSELAALPHSQREVIVLRYFAGLSDSQIALELDQPIGTVKSHLRRGLEQMRKAFT